MRKLLLLAVSAGLVAATMVALASASQSARSVTPESANPWLPVGATPAGTDWPITGGDLGNARFSTLTKLNTKNVAGLKQVWQVPFKGGLQTPEGLEQTPIVVSGKNKNLPLETGTMFFALATGIVALNPESGKILWQYQGPLYNPLYKDPLTGETQPNVQDRATRTESYGNGLVFVGQQDHSIIALNAKTGAPSWTAQVTAAGTFGVSTRYNQQPFTKFYDDGKDGLVLSGFTGGDSPLRGHLDAYNAKNGKLVWRTWTTPDPTQFPFILSWANPAEAAIGGAALWSVPAIDPQLGLIYFGTGNAYPETGRQPGKSLWTDSVLAVDWKTGALKWYFQEVHHDIWDHDAPNPPTRFNAMINGKRVPVVAHGNKSGYLYVLNAKNGGPVPNFPIPEVPTPDPSGKGLALTNIWKTQPIPQGGAGEVSGPMCWTAAMLAEKFPSYPLAPNGLPIKPGCPYTAPYNDAYVNGGCNSGGGCIGWPYKSYSPQTNYLYVCSQWSIQLKATVSATNPSTIGISSDPRAGVVPGVGGRITALDMGTNKIAWQNNYQGATDEDCYSGALATAGGLLFTASRGNPYTPPYFGGKLYAYDAKTGAELWSWQNKAIDGATPKGAGQIDSAPATWVTKGKQYVAINAIGRDAEGRIGNLMTVFSL
jgi:quinohemoprotein ethanol dehydrogenase